MNADILDKIKSRILYEKDYYFVTEFESNIGLSDNILMYNSGDQWKIIPLSVALSYPIIYDTFSISNENYKVSIILCPFTLRATIVKGIFEVETYNDTKMIIKDKDNNLMPINLGYTIDTNYIIHSNKRIDIKISNLRTAIINYANDSLFMKTNKNIIINPILNEEYYTNNIDMFNNELDEGLIHPKTLTYIIQYKSHKNESEKTSIILGKDCNKNSVTGYDLKKSGLFEYLKKYETKIINRSGYVMPILWYIAKEDYPDAKVIYINIEPKHIGKHNF
jgi:hypothetical protein